MGKKIKVSQKFVNEINILAIKYINAKCSLEEISRLKLESGKYREALEKAIHLAKDTLTINDD